VTRTPRFGRYVAVDWSAKSSPATGPDSIWIAVLDTGSQAVVLHNPPTRHEARALLAAVVVDDAATLVGIDVGLGYPAGTAARFGLAAGVAPWLATWRWFAEHVRDDHRNANNRFEVAADLNRRSGGAAGPFWGCPPGSEYDGLSPRKVAPDPLGPFRATELALRAAGRSPMSMWQLTGAGSVGSQSLTAVPVLAGWRDDLGERLVVWPFETGLAEPDVVANGVVVAEVWPTQFDPPYPAGTVRDAAQVAHVARALADADRSGELGRWFRPSVPADVARAVVDEEGWVLGP
jgi:hypothetical protein